MSDDLELRIRLAGEAGGLQAAASAGKKSLDEVTTAAQAEAAAFKTLTAESAALAAAHQALQGRVSALADANATLLARTTALEAQLRKTNKGLGDTGASAGQTAAAMRLLPAQITDVVTSLASGQQAWLVAIQQGGQIKDSFGGIVPAAQALRGAINPLTLGLVASAAAAAAGAIAYNQGAAEADAYRRAIVLTGNAAGTSGGQLADMAREIGKSVGTEHQAADALAQLAGTGRIAGDSLRLLGTAAVQMDRELGNGVADTVKQFEALAREPVKASVKLNEQYHYLTLSVYEQIKALDKQGQQQQAAKLATESYAQSMNARTAELNANLGSIERAWRGVADWAKRGWSAILNIGRESTLTEQLDSVNAQIAALDSRKSDNPALNARRREVLVDKAAALRESLRLQDSAALRQGEQTRADAEAIAKREAADRKGGGGKSEAEKAEDARERARLDAVKSNLAALTGAYSDAERILESQRAAGLVSEAQYWESKRVFIALNRDAQVQALEAENKALADQKASASERIALDSKIAQNKREMASVQAKAAADTVIANAQEAASVEQLRRATEAYVRQLDEARQARDRQHGRDLESLGRGDQARGLAGRQNALEDRYYDELRRLDSDRLTSKMPQSQYEERLAALQAYHQAALQAEERYQDEMVKAQGNGSLGMQRALENYLDRARDVAAQTESMFDTAFKGMEDALVEFVRTGKLDFASLADSIIRDLIRIAVQKQLAGFVGSIFGGGDIGITSGNTGLADYGLGGGRAFGGGVQRGRMYEVNELGPETLEVGGKTYLMMGRDNGRVNANRTGSVGSSSAGGGGSVTSVNMPITLINQTGTDATATARRRADGGIEILLQALKDAVASDLASGTGSVSQALRGTYGLRPTFQS